MNIWKWIGVTLALGIVAAVTAPLSPWLSAGLIVGFVGGALFGSKYYIGVGEAKEDAKARAERIKTEYLDK